MKATILATAIAVLLTAGNARAENGSAVYDPPVALDVTFKLHIDDDFAEQDVFVEREPGAGEVFRPTKAERNMKLPLYAAAKPVPQNPFDADALGPWPKGKPLGLTLGQWFEAEGAGRYTCENGEGHIDLTFSGLVPDGVYTMWHYFMAWPPTEPFIGTYDLPMGSRDGAQSVFVANSRGEARFERRFKPCLQLTGEHLASGLAIAWHSDGKTYGVEPGVFATNSHVQLYSDLPQRSGL